MQSHAAHREHHSRSAQGHGRNDNTRVHRRQATRENYFHGMTNAGSIALFTIRLNVAKGQSKLGHPGT